MLFITITAAKLYLAQHFSVRKLPYPKPLLFRANDFQGKGLDQWEGSPSGADLTIYTQTGSKSPLPPRIWFISCTVEKPWDSTDESMSVLLAVELRWEPVFQRLAVVWLRNDLLQPPWTVVWLVILQPLPRATGFPGSVKDCTCAFLAVC